MKNTAIKEYFDNFSAFQKRVTELEARLGTATIVECLAGCTRVTWRRRATATFRF